MAFVPYRFVFVLVQIRVRVQRQGHAHPSAVPLFWSGGTPRLGSPLDQSLLGPHRGRSPPHNPQPARAPIATATSPPTTNPHSSMEPTTTLVLSAIRTKPERGSISVFAY
jgi:hypothetical protein